MSEPASTGPDLTVTSLAGGLPGGSPDPGVRFRPARAPSWPFIIVLLLALAGVFILATAASALFVFGVGAALAFFLVPVVNWLERRGLPRWIAAILTVVVTLATIIGIGLTIVVIVVEQGLAFIENLPTITQELEEWYASLALPDWLRSALDAIAASLSSSVDSMDEGSVTAGILGSTLSFIGGLFAWFLLPFFLFYLLKDQPRMSGSFYARVPAPWHADVSRILTITVGNIAQYFKAELVVGSIMFVMVTLGTFIIGVIFDAQHLQQFAILLGLTAFVMELIPQIGPILSYIPALLLAIPAGVDVIVVVSIFYFVAFNIEGSILVPNVQGKMISFTGATVLVLIAIGFALGGIVGAILALPVASIVRDLARHFFDKAVAESLVPVASEASSASGGAAAG